MTAVRQICIVLDASANLRNHFKVFHRQYIDPILKQLSRVSDKLIPVEFGLVLFQDYPPYSDILVRAFPFTSNAKDYESLLDNIQFYGGQNIETAVTEGLSLCLTVND